MTPAEFSSLCAAHDWTYEFSDDQRAWRKGRDEAAVLKLAYLANPALLPIYNEWVAWINSPGTLPRPQIVK